MVSSRPPLIPTTAAAVTSDANVTLVKVCSAESEEERREHSALWDSGTTLTNTVLAESDLGPV